MIDLYVPIAIAFVLVMLSLNLLPAALATYRERGILRRLFGLVAVRTFRWQ